jgi:hypothetical protein
MGERREKGRGCGKRKKEVDGACNDTVCGTSYAGIVSTVAHDNRRQRKRERRRGKTHQKKMEKRTGCTSPTERKRDNEKEKLVLNWICAPQTCAPKEHICLLSGSPPFCPRHLLGRVDTKKRQKECMGHRDLVFCLSPHVLYVRLDFVFFVFPRGKLVENSQKPDRRQTSSSSHRRSRSRGEVH